MRLYTDEQLDKMNAKENEKKEFNGKEYTTYEATQRMRQLEGLLIQLETIQILAVTVRQRRKRKYLAILQLQKY